jgi:hypothetical protein
MCSGAGLFAAAHGRLVEAKPCVHLVGKIRPQESCYSQSGQADSLGLCRQAGYVFLEDGGIGSCQSQVTISRNVVDVWRFVDMHVRKSSAHESAKETAPTSERYGEKTSWVQFVKLTEKPIKNGITDAPRGRRNAICNANEIEEIL